MCNLKFFEQNEHNWREISQGYLLGLYEDPGDYNLLPKSPNSCTDCKNFGHNIGELNKGTVLIEKYRDLWLDKQKVTSEDILKIGQTLLETYNVFMNLLKPLDRLL